jgi:uncharacterized SAM-binding protein YcdF (DUF218 family)
MTRIVAVLGFSNGRRDALHHVCAARLARAEQEANAEDIVLFSGWARGRVPVAEADLMARAWSSPVRARVVDRGARTTLGNALGVARLVRRLGADEVVLVTSGWHGRRAEALTRIALRGTGARLRVVTSDEEAPFARRPRELASWLVVPLLALVARTR